MPLVTSDHVWALNLLRRSHDKLIKDSGGKFVIYIYTNLQSTIKLKTKRIRIYSVI